MRALPTRLHGVLVLEPKVHGDERGFFLESWNAQAFAELTGCTRAFVQDNQSRSARNVLRGLHYQLPPQAQDKLVRVVAGEILDVAVDLRRGSPTFGRWEAVKLSAKDHRQLWIPAGCAHGFRVLSDSADVAYKVTDYYAPALERSIRWDDPQLAIDWGGGPPPQVSARDASAGAFADAATFP